MKPDILKSHIGSVGPVDRNRLLGKTRVMLLPIAFEDPFGLTVVESMACGTPVIAFDRDSMPELIDDGKNGFLVDTLHAGVVRHGGRYITLYRLSHKDIRLLQRVITGQVS